MLRRFKARLKFVLERWIQRGAWYQFLAIAALIACVAGVGGLLAWGLTDAFDHPAAAVWWSFLRLTDPGYLGDDEGTTLRVISTAVTVLGYVLFMGSLIAILTQWLNQTMRRLESGLTPISINDHVLILGWTNRTPLIVRELLHSEGRIRRFLRRRGARRLRIVVLAEDVDQTLRAELREHLGPLARKHRVILRSGSSMRIEHLRRVDFTNAAAIILPGADFALGGAEATDARIVKTLMSIAKYGRLHAREQAPALVAELFDPQKVPIARQAYQGELDVVAGNLFISRLIAQTVRHRGLSYVYSELLSHLHGNEIYVRSHPDFAGRPLLSLIGAFSNAILLGVVRPEGNGFRPYLNPGPDFVVERDDRFVLVARSYEACRPDAEAADAQPASEPVSHPVPVQGRRRILMLGWSQKVITLLPEFAGFGNERFEIDLFSRVPAAERQVRLERAGIPADRLRVRQLEGDYTLQGDVAQLDLGSYDNIVLLASDWLETGEEADARTILGYVLLRSMLPDDESAPEVLVELVDPSNARLFQRRPGEVIISPVILSHMLAHTALRRELNTVFGELFGPGGAEIFFRSCRDYGMEGRDASFQDVRQAAARRGEIALGLRRSAESAKIDGGIYLNPPPDERWTLAPHDEILVLTTYA